MQRKPLEIEADICNKLDQLKITMFGRRIHNPNPLQSKRTFYDIHPYVKQGSGVSCTITYTDAKTNIPYVLLAKKKNKNQYDQVGGYTHGQGPEGSEINFDQRSEDERDRAEEEILRDINAVQVAKKNDEAMAEPYSLKQLKEVSEQGFTQQQFNKLGKKTNPIEMKAIFSQQGIAFKNDYNSWDTALRETQEETGLDLTHYKPKELYTADDFGISNEDERLHTKVTHYLFHLGTLKDPPLVKPGSDVELLTWIPVTDIQLSAGKVKGDFPVRKSYLLQTLPRALKKLRELELAVATNDMFVKYKSLGAYTFSDPFSLAACEYHQAILAKAIKMSEVMKEQWEYLELPSLNQPSIGNGVRK